MSARLYTAFKHPSTGRKVYYAAQHGRHVVKLFRTATMAQVHAEKLQARYDRLKKAEA